MNRDTSSGVDQGQRAPEVVLDTDGGVTAEQECDPRGTRAPGLHGVARCGVVGLRRPGAAAPVALGALIANADDGLADYIPLAAPSLFEGSPGH